MKGKKEWRLSRTLSRPVAVRPIEDADVKYAWGAYKKNALGPMEFAGDLSASEFKAEFEHYVLRNAQAAWTVMAHTRQGFVPIGFGLGQWGPMAAYMAIAGIIWFPWASRRNIVEGTVALFNRLRREFGSVIGFANEEHKPLYEACCMHGIMRRVGTSHGLKKSVFETRG